MSEFRTGPSELERTARGLAARPALVRRQGPRRSRSVAVTALGSLTERPWRSDRRGWSGCATPTTARPRRTRCRWCAAREPADQLVARAGRRDGRTRTTAAGPGGTTRCTTRRSPAPGWPGIDAGPQPTTGWSFARGRTPASCRWRRPAWSITVRAEQHLAGLRRRGDPQGVPPGLPRATTRTSRCTRRCAGRAAPGTSPGCSGTCRGSWPTAPSGDDDRVDLAMLQEFFRDRHRRLGAGQDQRPRPVRRGRPARRRGRRRLRRRVAPARRGHRGGARRPGPGAAAPPSWARTSWPRRPAAMRRRLDAAVAAVPAAGSRTSDGLQRRLRRAGGVTACRCRCSGCTATSTSVRCCARSHRLDAARLRGRAGQAADRAAPRWTRRCGTSPGCCARSTTRPGTCSPTTRASRSWTYRAEEWAQRNRDAFCDGLRRGGRARPARPSRCCCGRTRPTRRSTRCVYEARNRPSWLPIPLASLARLTEGARS